MVAQKMSSRLIDTGRITVLKNMSGEQFGDIVKSFIQSTTRNISLAKTSFESGDQKTLHRAVHSLKGSAGTLGATHLGELAADTEAAVLENRADVGSYLERLIATHRETIAELQNI